MINSYVDFVTFITPYLMPAGIFGVAAIVLLSMIKDSIAELRGKR